MAEAKCTLAHKKNLRDNETANKAALLARIKAATGVDYTFEFQPTFDELVVQLIKAKSQQHEKAGEALYHKDDGYLAHIAKLLENSCKDDMIKEAIVEATPNKKILLVLSVDDVEPEKFYQFKDGNLVVTVGQAGWYRWMNQWSRFDLSKIL